MRADSCVCFRQSQFDPWFRRFCGPSHLAKSIDKHISRIFPTNGKPNAFDGSGNAGHPCINGPQRGGEIRGYTLLTQVDAKTRTQLELPFD